MSTTEMTTDAGTAVLELRNLTTEFVTKRGAFRAVDDVSLELHAGKTLCVVLQLPTSRVAN